MAKAADVSPEIDILLWWKNHSADLPKWSTAARDVVLVQPSSAAAERLVSDLSVLRSAARLFSSGLHSVIVDV